MPLIVLASGAQVKPSKINFDVAGDTFETFLTVFNPSSEVQLFEVYPDDFENSIMINPKSFTLEAGENKKVKITATLDENIQDSQISTNISVISKPLSESDFSVGAGIKIPINISFKEIAKTNYTYYFITPLMVLFLMCSYLIWKKRPRLLKKVVK
jgi:hypothetical protein